MRLLNKSGSIVQVLIISIVMIAISAAIYNQFFSIIREQKNVYNKIEYAGTQALAKDIMLSIPDCNCQVAGKVFDSTSSAPNFGLKQMTMSCATGAPLLVKVGGVLSAAQVDVDSIEVKDIVSTGNPHEYYGDLHVSSPIEVNKLRSLRSTPIRFMFHTVPTSPANARVVKGCGYAPIATPTGLAAQVGPGTGTCTFTWNASVTGRKPLIYTVRGGTVSGAAATGDKFCEGSDNSLTCQISNLTVGVRHYFAVQASNPYQEPSPFSSEVSCIPAQLPSVPVPTAAPGNMQCTISWPASTGTTPITYTVFKSSAHPATTASEQLCVGTSATSCVSTGLTNDQTYYYAVQAKNIAGVSDISATVSCTPFLPPYCYIRRVANRAIKSITCPAGFTTMKQGYGCSSAGMYNSFDWRGSNYRIIRSGLWMHSGDHFAYPFRLFNNTLNATAYNGWWDSACYYFYHGKPIYGDWPWAVCCQ